MAYTFKHGDRPLDGITVQRAVGRGGFGEVYYALTDSGKQVALKYLRDNADVELRGVAHVMNLKSPHLITIYDVKKDAQADPWVIMEYISGPSLRDLLIAEPNGLGAQKAAFFTIGIAKGLSYLHDRGIVHRDLKPGNIFYDDGYVKIGDYGLSKYIAVSQHSGQTMSVGTVHYMAPEIGSGHYTKAIDIYALGVILFEMLTGRLPFSGSSMGEILMRHISEKPDVSGLPEPFGAIVAKALAKNPEHRYQDANEMIDALASAGGVSESIASFDHSSLSKPLPPVPGFDPDRTMTTPPRRPNPPQMDAREAWSAAALRGKLEGRAEKLARKFEAKVAKWEKKFGSRGRSAPLRPALSPRGAPQNRVALSITLAVVSVAVAVGLGFLSNVHNHTPEAVVSLVLLMFGGTAGGLFTHLFLLPRVPTRNSIFDRLAYASIGALFMVPGIAVGDEVGRDFELLFLGPVVAMCLCDWNQRIERGRQTLIQGGDAFWPAVIGLVLAGWADVDTANSAWVGAGLTAAFTLLTQAAAAMWPPGEPRRAGVKAPLSGGPGSLRTAATIAARDAMRGAHEGIQSAVAALSGRSDASEEDESRTGAVATAVRRAEPAAALDPAQPSFVGRAANAGLSIVAKMLLLAGLICAVSHSAIEQSERADVERYNRKYVVMGLPPQTADSIPKAVPLGLLAGGFVTLVLARRNDGALHFLRGIVGCALGFAAGIAALGPASGALATFFGSNDWDTLGHSRNFGLLITTGIGVGLSLVLLFWPKKSRHPRSIVL